MPTSAERADVLVDTSAAIPLLVADHELHRVTSDALGSRRLGLPGHAAFETFSVLTCLPPPARRSPSVVRRLIAANFPATVFLATDRASRLLDRLAEGDLGGGAVYDALVAAAAKQHGVPVATHDRRALDTYRAIGADIEILLRT